jgi:RimJ/RimL family protein N-acetyltransferase
VSASRSVRLRRDLAETYACWVNDLEVRHGLMFAGVVSPQSEETYLDEALKEMAERQPSAAHFTVYDRDDGAPVGTASLMEVNHLAGRARYGILLGERRGRGLGTEATRLVLDWGFTVLGLHNVLLEVMPWNERAIRAYERAGFRRVGVRRGALVSMGERCDELLMDAIAPELGASVLRPREQAGERPPTG